MSDKITSPLNDGIRRRKNRFMWLGTGCFTVRQTTFKATLSKVVKHEKMCSDNQHIFILFIIHTFSFLISKVMDLL